MNDIAMPVAESGGELTTIPRETALAVLTDAEKFDAFYAKVKAEVDAHVPDVTTAKGREAIKALAFKVVKTKTAIDAAGKLLTEEWRTQTAAVDASRKKIRDQLDALRDEVKRPVTQWEAADAARIERCQSTIARLKAMTAILLEDTSEGVAARLDEAQAIEITEEDFGDLYEYATDTRVQTVTALAAGRDKLAAEEADRAELARLREEAEARAAAAEAARQERERQEAEATAAREREEAEQARLAAEEQARQAAAERAEQEAQAREEAARLAAEEAAEQARAEAAAQAQREQEERDRQHQAALAAAERARVAAEEEARRLADERAAEAEAAAETRRAAEVRAADHAHRGPIMREAKEALMEHGGVSEEVAKAIVLAITAGTIPHVSIQF